MNKQDARKLEPAAQYELRKQVIRAWKRGRNRVQISDEVGLSYVSVCNIVKRYRLSEDKGVSALAPARRGRREGESRTLTAEQEAHIQRLICERRPEQLKMVFALWSRAAVMQLVEREYGIKLSIRGIGKTTSSVGDLPRKSRSKRPMSSAPRQFRPGWMSNTPRLNGAPRQKVPRFIGVMKLRWSIPMCVGAATRQRERPR